MVENAAETRPSGPLLTRRQAAAVTLIGITGLVGGVIVASARRLAVDSRHSNPNQEDKVVSAQATAAVFDLNAIATARAQAPNELKKSLAIDSQTRDIKRERAKDIDANFNSPENFISMAIIPASAAAILFGLANLGSGKSEEDLIVG